MDRKAALISICAALGTLLTALSSHGANALAALSGVPALLQAWASGLPLGLWSFFLAFVLATLVWVAAIRRLPVGSDGKAPFGQANVIALIVGLTVTVAQQYVSPVKSAGGLLNAVWIGLLAGLLAPHIGTILRGKARSKRVEE